MTFEYVILTADPFGTKPDLMVHHHKLDCLLKRLDCSIVVKVKVTGRLKVPVNVHLDSISSAAEPCVAKLLSQWDFSHWKFRLLSPGKATCDELCYPVHAGCYGVSTVHQTLTWTTGSL